MNSVGPDAEVAVNLPIARLLADPRLAVTETSIVCLIVIDPSLRRRGGRRSITLEESLNRRDAQRRSHQVRAAELPAPD